LFGARAVDLLSIQQILPDAMRLCLQAFPSETRIILCLAKNKQKLSAACTMAFSRARSAGAAGGQQAGR
jgi:hypothetical protein